MEKIWFWGLGGLGAISTVNSTRRVARKARRIILRNSGLLTLQFHVHDPRHQFFHFGDTKIPQIIQEVQDPFSGTVILGNTNSLLLGIRCFANVRKCGAAKS